MDFYKVMYNTRQNIVNVRQIINIFFVNLQGGLLVRPNLKKTVMEKNDLVVLMTFARVNDAELHRSLLESAGIEAYVLDEFMGTVFPVGGDLEVRLAVAGKNEKKAREILAADFDHESFKAESKASKQ